MIQRLGTVLSRFASRWVPDPFVLAILLTFVTFGLAAAVMGTDVTAAVDFWGGELGDGKVVKPGLWKFLSFGMMMCLVLVTGHALASAKPMRRVIRGLADRPQTATQAIALTALCAMTCGLLNWGLGLIVGALLARDVALSAKRRGIKVHYPLLAASGYTGLLVWHGGLSGSAPMTITQTATVQKVLGKGISIPEIPLTDTIFSPMNICVSIAVLCFVPFILSRMAPSDDAVLEIDPACFEEDEPEASDTMSEEGPASWLNGSRWLGWALAAVVFAYLGRYVAFVGVGKVDLNFINLLFLGLGLAIYGRPAAYAKAIGDATSGCSGIILQFPIYAGIMAVMVQSGLVKEMALFIQSIATPETYGAFTFMSAGGVNLFVPSGGGQFGVQGPVVVQAATELDVPYGKAIMAFAYGDQWTNMLQPFWALPLLGITKLKASQIIGYTAALMFLVAPIYLVALSVF
jgi:short-chain fatty acids transporter